MPRITYKEKKIAWIVSITVGIIVIATGFGAFLGTPLLDEYVLFGIMLMIFPPSILDYVDYRWRRSIDEHLPDLFRTIVQAKQTGMTLPKAIEDASKREYGALTKELRKMVAQMSWGMSFEEALEALGKRVDTFLIKRIIPLIIEASKAGGHIEKIFDPLGRFVQSTLMFEKQRKAETRPYIVITYIAFFVFLLTIVLLFRTFFIQTNDLPAIGITALSPESTRRILFNMSVIQGLFGGLIAGKMGEGTVSAGLKHSLVLMLCAYFVFKFAL
jgi:flagellar protein FlaJ